ncbi:hypothetical protein Tco_0349824 [Tanacetum coccineum]
MSNSNTNLQTQSSNALHNAIMEAGSKDRPPNENSSTIVSKIHHTYINGLRKQFQLLKGKNNDIYSTVDAVRSMRKWKAIERVETRSMSSFLLQLQPEGKGLVTLVKQSQELKTVSRSQLNVHSEATPERSQ